MPANLLLLGCGRMGGALLQGWQNAGLDYTYMVVDPYSEAEGVSTFKTLDDIPNGYQPDIVVLAVKPQMWDNINETLAQYSNALVTSVMAGKTIADISTPMQASKVVRAMPNIPAMVGQGATACVASDAVTEKEKDAITALYNAVGQTVWIEDEKNMDAVTAISGSGPAYVFHFAEALEKAGIALELPHNVARSLAYQTIIGAAETLKEHDATSLREQVTSPNGTTQAGLDILMQESGGLESLLKKTAQAAKARSEEL